jgi:hypothetical protein
LNLTNFIKLSLKKIFRDFNNLLPLSDSASQLKNNFYYIILSLVEVYHFLKFDQNKNKNFPPYDASYWINIPDPVNHIKRIVYSCVDNLCKIRVSLIYLYIKENNK